MLLRNDIHVWVQERMYLILDKLNLKPGVTSGISFVSSTCGKEVSRKTFRAV
jgi:hypothetical protein